MVAKRSANTRPCCPQGLPCCPPKPSLAKRPLIGAEQAQGLAQVYEVLANDTRLRILHALARQGELPVTGIAETLEMKVPAVSNQLQKMGDLKILAHRRNGNNVYYRIIDPCVMELLDRGLCLAEDAKERRA